MADIPSEKVTGPGNLIDSLICPFYCLGYVFTNGGNTENPAAVGYDCTILCFCSGVKDFNTVDFCASANPLMLFPFS